MSGWSWDTIERLGIGSWIIAPAEGDAPPRGASIDTRTLEPGNAFVAYAGARTDGHRHLMDAQHRGAALALVTSSHAVPDELTIPTLGVGDATEALTALARAWRRGLGGRVIGVTGSNGKTTCVGLIASVLGQGARVSVSARSYNNEIGVPLGLLNADPEADFVVSEIGTSSPGEIDARSALARPDIAVITSIGRAHLEQLGSLEGVAREKARILAHTSELGIVPGDSGELDAVLASDPPRIPLERIDAGRVRVTGGGVGSIAFTLDGEPFTAPLPGAHNASSAAIAVLIGRACGLGDDPIRAGLARARVPEMRLDRVEIPTAGEPIVVYNDAYNANPDSMRAALSFFGALDAPGKIAVLGDMLELGECAHDEHARLVADLEDAGIRAALVGPLLELAARESDLTASASVSDESITAVARTIEPGATVLLKASRGIALERLIYVLINTHAPGAGRAGASAPDG